VERCERLFESLLEERARFIADLDGAPHVVGLDARRLFFLLVGR
jgi:hypothetical protein